jgi:hypothetical protein
MPASGRSLASPARSGGHTDLLKPTLCQAAAPLNHFLLLQHATGFMKPSAPLKSENYLGFFLLLLALMAFALLVKSCNIARSDSSAPSRPAAAAANHGCQR